MKDPESSIAVLKRVRLLGSRFAKMSTLLGTQLCRRIAYPCWKSYTRYQPWRNWKRRAGSEDFVPRRGSGPLREVGPKLERMADFIDRFENEMFGGMETFFPAATREGMRVAMDVREDDEKYTICADLPGMSKKDVKIQVRHDRHFTPLWARMADIMIWVV